jgi:vacuolar-type H+-ATPase subunit I/STV1
MSDKVMVGAKVDPELKEAIDQQPDLNTSGAIREFLQHYVASGQSTEAALAVRKERIEQELAELEREVRQKESELERVNELLNDKADKRRGVFESFSEFDGVNVTPENPAVQEHAERADMTPEEFVKKYEEWSQ